MVTMMMFNDGYFMILLQWWWLLLSLLLLCCLFSLKWCWFLEPVESGWTNSRPDLTHVKPDASWNRMNSWWNSSTDPSYTYRLRCVFPLQNAMNSIHFLTTSKQRCWQDFFKRAGPHELPSIKKNRKSPDQSMLLCEFKCVWINFRMVQSWFLWFSTKK